MRNAPVRKLGPVPSEQPRKNLRNAAPLLEGARTLSDQEVHNVIALFGGRRARKDYFKFIEAKEKASDTYGAVLELVGGREQPTKVATRYEFRTTDRSLDTDLEHMVSAMGFKLSLRSEPVTGPTDEDRYELRTRTMQTAEGKKVLRWYEPRTERTYVVREGNYGSCDVQYAARTAENFLRLLEALRPPMAEDMPRAALPAGVVDINSLRPAPRQPVSGEAVADQALTALKTSL